jgi:alanyl-tRNA synthetase
MHANELRRAFTQFFADRGHVLVPSEPLVPHHPRAPLFTNAGMNQFIPYFLGEEQPPYTRAMSIQKCVRIRGKHDDIENVGRSSRHLTFFEMLGNWSFGDYFKQDAIRWAWELVTGPLGLDGDRIWVSVYKDDEEAEQIWRDEVGFPAARLRRLGDEDNFWEMGETGPCGPDSELYYDRGPEFGGAGGPGSGHDERYVELWNLVFIQFERQLDGSLAPLPQRHVDTGAGFERLLSVLQDVPSVWETDVLRPIIAEAEALTGRRYGDDAEVDVSLRILADHARSVTFLIADGVMPSNEERGYVLRRLLRRAVRQAYMLGVERDVAPALVESVVSVMGEAYPELRSSSDRIIEVVEREEARFRTTLRSGLAMLEAELASGASVVSGDVAFRLHDTHGFPIELTREIAGERGAAVDEIGFAAAMEQQRESSKKGVKGEATTEPDLVNAYRDLVAEHGTTGFVGYSEESATASVLEVLYRDDERAEIFLDVTPFYAEGGGQIGDTGIIETDSGLARVADTTYALPGLIRHVADIDDGEIRPGQRATATIDRGRRAAIRRNHTGTHLLHWALREVLGDHVKQQGSLVAPDRLRFDFTHYNPMTADEIARVEDLVNDAVLADDDVRVLTMSKVDADEAGAIAFFEEKYGDEVRVVQAGSESVELCGGTHVARLGQIGPMEIVSEGSIGSNLRRIEATTGTATLARLREAERQISEAAGLLRATPEELTVAVERKVGEYRDLESRLRATEQAALAARAREIVAAAQDGTLVVRVDGLGNDQLRELAVLARQMGDLRAAVIGGSPDGSRAALVAVADKGSDISAPDLIKDAAKTVGGGGGGRNPELASAGGKDASRLDEALDQVRGLLKE